MLTVQVSDFDSNLQTYQMSS